MALIRNFVHRPSAKASFRSEVECGWVVAEVEGRRILHLETYGSVSREIPGKASQTLDLDADAARELRALIDQTFPPT